MATVQTAIDLAVERSNLNDPDLIPSTELVGYVSAYEKRIYLAAAAENPDFFGREGNTTVRSAATDTWNLAAAPGNLCAVSRLEVQSLSGSVSGVSQGDEVFAVSVRRPWTAVGPRVYIRNRVAHELDGSLTDGANFVSRLKVFYSYLPPTRTTTTETLDLPEEFINLVVLPLARTMALRDQRPDEVAPIDAEYSLDYENFLGQASTFDEVAIREIQAIPAANRGR